MLQQVYLLSKVYDDRFFITYYHYVLEDSDFGQKTYKLTDDNCAFTRIVASEYSERHLNVAYNLKLLFSELTRGQYYIDAIEMLHTNIYVCEDYGINIEQYQSCLEKHLKRLRFVGRLK
jgi:hypothetical protein